MKRTATAVWNGSLKEGNGTLTAPGGALKATPYSFNSRFASGAGTNPEELIAAAHSGCFAMALSAALGEAGFKPDRLEVTAEVSLDNLASLCQVLSMPKDDLWTFALPDGRGIRKAMEFLYPFLADKSKWPLKPDVQAWGAWPARQPGLLFAGLAFQEPSYLALWKQLPADPTNTEVRRNLVITQPILWLSN